MESNSLSGENRARGHDLGQNWQAPNKILDTHCMDYRRGACQALTLPQEGGLFQVAFDEMNGSIGPAGQRARKHKAGKAAS